MGFEYNRVRNNSVWFVTDLGTVARQLQNQPRERVKLKMIFNIFQTSSLCSLMTRCFHKCVYVSRVRKLIWDCQYVRLSKPQYNKLPSCVFGVALQQDALSRQLWPTPVTVHRCRSCLRWHKCTLSSNIWKQWSRNLPGDNNIILKVTEFAFNQVCFHFWWF